MAKLTSTFVLALLTISQIISYAQAKSDIYVIHMDLSAMPRPFSSDQGWYLATLSSISDTSKATSTPTSKLLYSYTNSIRGFSASLSLPELEALKKVPGYISSTRDHPLKAHTTRTSQFLGLSSSVGAWPASNYGEGVIIGLLDTGIWPESESFSDEGMSDVPSRWKGKCESGTQFNSSLCNKKLVGARFYNKGFIANNPEVKIKMNSPRDTDGHGTHTSSTAAGSYVKGASYFGYGTGTARGMAPRAHIAMYKVIWRYGVYSSDVLAAIDQAIQDGVDILSLSLALAVDDNFLEDDPIAVATYAAMEKGVFVVASAGNDGPLYWSLINGAPWVLTVGAGTLDRQFEGVLTLGNGIQIPFPSLYPGNSSHTQMLLGFLDACASVKEMRLADHKIIVCKDNLSISGQVENAKSAGVSGAVFITDIYLSDFYTRSSFPAAFIDSLAGKTVLDYIRKTRNATGSLQFQKTVIPTKPAPMVDDYSSRGPFPRCPFVLKPDILAPGSVILASWSPKSSVAEIGSASLFNNFNLLSGTSMATPHVAGVAAVIKRIHPDWSPAAIRSALMTTTNSLDNTLTPIKDAFNNNRPASPLDIGAGHVNPNKAVDPGLVYDAAAEDYIKLLCGMNFTSKQIRTITGSPHSCQQGSLDLNYPSFIAYFNEKDSQSDRKVLEFLRTVTNMAEGGRSYTAKITGMKGLKVNVEPQRLVFKHKYEKQSYRLGLEGPRFLKEDLVYGFLSWVDNTGKYIVSSPIVATNFVQD